MLKQITLLSIALAASSAFANSDSTLTPFDSVSVTSVNELFQSITDSNDYIMPITSGQTAYFTKIETKLMHRDATVTVQPEQMTVADLKATSNGSIPNWDVSVPKTIVGASVNNDTLFVMGSTDNRLDFQQGLLRVTKTATGWSEPSKVKIKGFKPTSWSYGMYMHPTGDVLLMYQKTIIADHFELFVSLKIDSNTYGKPMNLTTVNSEGNEITPYLSMDKKRLYFSSNGYNDESDSTQADNYDLFVSQVLTSDFSELSTPERLPTSINTKTSYEAYVSEIDSNNIIFSSNRNGAGMRLYASHLTRGYKEPEPVIEAVVEVIEVAEVVEEVTPEPVVVEPKKIVLSSEELHFENNQHNASPEAKAALLKNFPFSEENDAHTTQITITGYSDSNGAASYNQSLSKKRAQTMKDILVEMGWSADKIKVIGMGEENPIADNATREGRAKNRRVEFEVK
ncbi:MAG: OmpA family protein [Salibacteraceae bacterium]